MTQPLSTTAGTYDLKSSPAQPAVPPNYQNPQATIYVQPQQPSMMAYPPLVMQPPVSPGQPSGAPVFVSAMKQPLLQSSQLSPPSQVNSPLQTNAQMQPNPHIIQQQPQFIQAPTAAQIGVQYQAELFAQCAQGQHQYVKTYGPIGIITAVLCFPIGLVALLVDTKTECSRCKARI